MAGDLRESDLSSGSLAANVTVMNKTWPYFATHTAGSSWHHTVPSLAGPQTGMSGYNLLPWCCNYPWRKCFEVHVFQEPSCLRDVWTQFFAQVQQPYTFSYKRIWTVIDRALCTDGGVTWWRYVNYKYVCTYCIIFSLASIFCHAFIKYQFWLIASSAQCTHTHTCSNSNC